ncbi:EamA family transporter [Halovivax sp.]|uniref:EamA family transporter n=1 Tax=Halovivax sp. TaxID=1935978 RepID=UPI0025BFEAB0|nr:EamA family transporter [Halovivax sp.]
MELVYASGVLLAALAALLWAVHNLLIRIATERGSVGDAILVVMVVNLLLVAPAAVVRHHPTYGLTWEAAGAFAAAGVAGLVLGRICLFGGIRAIGASRTTPVVSASTLVSAALAVWLLGESLTALHLVGIVLVVGGVAVISWLTATDAGRDGAGGQWRALALPLGAALFIGIEPILVRYGLDGGAPLLVGLTVMMATALATYVGYRRLRGEALAPLRGNPILRWYLAAGLASTAGLVTYFGALAVAPVVIVIPVLQTSPLLVIALSAALLPTRLERVTWRLAAAATIVVAGATLVSLSG